MTDAFSDVYQRTCCATVYSRALRIDASPLSSFEAAPSFASISYPANSRRLLTMRLLTLSYSSSIELKWNSCENTNGASCGPRRHSDYDMFSYWKHRGTFSSFPNVSWIVADNVGVVNTPQGPVCSLSLTSFPKVLRPFFHGNQGGFES